MSYQALCFIENKRNPFCTPFAPLLDPVWHAKARSLENTSTSTWLHAAVNHDFCSAGGCDLKRIKRNDRKVRSEKKI